MQANSIDEAINLVNQNKKYCNGTSIFTGSGTLARKFQIEIETRQVCINAAVPAPLPLFSLTCSELSFAGDINANGKAGVQFYTQIKTVTQQWKEFSSSGGGLTFLTSNYPQSDDGLSQGLQAFQYQSGAGDYQSGDGITEGLQSIDYQSGAEPLALHSRDFSNGDGVHLALHPNDFPGGDGESLGEHSGDIPSGNGISPTIPISDGSHWTLNF